MPGIVFRRGTLLIHTGPHPHLHVVMNDPVHCNEVGDHSVLVVNLSSVKPGSYHDPSCILLPGCHPFVRMDSWVMYSHSVVLKVPRIEHNIAIGDIQHRDPVSLETFEAIRNGFGISPHVKPKITRYMKLHGI